MQTRIKKEATKTKNTSWLQIQLGGEPIPPKIKGLANQSHQLDNQEQQYHNRTGSGYVMQLRMTVDF